jgi:hypothetical protein
MMARTKWSGGRRILESTRRPMSGPAECVISRGSPETEFCPAMDAIPAEEASAHPTADPLAGVLTPPSDLVPSMVGLRRAGREFVSLTLPGLGQAPKSKLALWMTSFRFRGFATCAHVESAWASLQGPSEGEVFGALRRHITNVRYAPRSNHQCARSRPRALCPRMPKTSLPRRRTRPGLHESGLGYGGPAAHSHLRYG